MSRAIIKSWPRPTAKHWNFSLFGLIWILFMSSITKLWMLLQACRIFQFMTKQLIMIVDSSLENHYKGCLWKKVRAASVVMGYFINNNQGRFKRVHVGGLICRMFVGESRVSRLQMSITVASSGSHALKHQPN